MISRILVAPGHCPLCPLEHNSGKGEARTWTAADPVAREAAMGARAPQRCPPPPAGRIASLPTHTPTWSSRFLPSLPSPAQPILQQSLRHIPGHARWSGPRRVAPDSRPSPPPVPPRTAFPSLAEDVGASSVEFDIEIDSHGVREDRVRGGPTLESWGHPVAALFDSIADARGSPSNGWLQGGIRALGTLVNGDSRTAGAPHGPRCAPFHGHPGP